MHGGVAIARVAFDETKAEIAAGRTVDGRRDGGGRRGLEGHTWR